MVHLMADAKLATRSTCRPPGWMKAIDVFRDHGDWLGLARAVLLASRAYAPPRRIRGLLEEAVAAADGRDDGLWASVVATIAGRTSGWHAVAGLSLPGDYPARLARALQVARACGGGEAEEAVLTAKATVAIDAYEPSVCSHQVWAAQSSSRSNAMASIGGPPLP